MPNLPPTIRLRRRTSRPLRARRVFAFAFCAVAGLANAQITDNPDWKESDAPPPPAFDLKRLLPIEMPPYMSLKFGVDPATLTVTGDGVVRYVVVATSTSGAVNAFYEGVRCATDEVKVYARYNSGAWHAVEAADWKRIDNLNSRYTRELAQQGLCRGRAPRASTSDMVRELKRPEILLR